MNRTEQNSQITTQMTNETRSNKNNHSYKSPSQKKSSQKFWRSAVTKSSTATDIQDFSQNEMNRRRNQFKLGSVFRDIYTNEEQRQEKAQNKARTLKRKQARDLKMNHQAGDDVVEEIGATLEEMTNREQTLIFQCTHGDTPCELKSLTAYHVLRREYGLGDEFALYVMTGGSSFFERILIRDMLATHRMVIPQAEAWIDDIQIDFDGTYASEIIPKRDLERFIDEHTLSWFVGDKCRTAFDTNLTISQAFSWYFHRTSEEEEAWRPYLASPVNAQGWFDTTITIPGLTELVQGIVGQSDQGSIVNQMADFLTNPKVEGSVNVAHTLPKVEGALRIDHNLAGAIDPLIEQLVKKRQINWRAVIVDGLFAILHMYQARFSYSSIILSIVQFIRTLPVGATVVTELLTNIKYYLTPGNAQAETDNVSILCGALTIGALIFTTLGLGALPGGKYTNDLFARLSRMGAVISSLSTLKDFFMNAFEEIFEYVRVNWFGYTSTRLNEWQEMEDWCAEVAQLNNSNFEREVVANDQMKTQVDLLLLRGDDLLKKFDKLRTPAVARTRFNTHYMFLSRIRSTVALGGAGMHVPRVPAIVFHFVGETGVGKSEMVSMLNAILLADQGVTKPEDMAKLIYYRDSSQQRFDGYISAVQGVVIDDYGSRVDTQANPNPEPLELIRMANGCVWKLEMPNLSEKGTTFFQAKWVILTSNASDFSYPSLTNPDAVSRRIAYKYIQKPHPDFAIKKNINNAEVITLDVAKVDAAAEEDEDVYEKCWLFDKMDPTTTGVAIVRENMTFAEVANELVHAVRRQQNLGEKKLDHTRRMFERVVARRQLGRPHPIVVNAHMEQERPQRELQRTATNEADVTQVKHMLKQKEQVQDEVTYISAASKAELLYKAEIVADYFFNGGGDPYRDSRGHKDLVKDVTLSKPETWFTTAECIFRSNTGELYHHEDFKPSIVEKMTKCNHINLAKLVALNPEFVEKFDLAGYCQGERISPVDYSWMLQENCLIVPEKYLEEFATAFCTASSYYFLDYGTTAVERAMKYKILDLGMFDNFNAIMHFYIGHIPQGAIMRCPEHTTGEKWYTSMYHFMTRVSQAVEAKAASVKFWAKMVSSEIIFSTIRIVGGVLLSIVITTFFTKLYYWLFGKSAPKKGKKPNTEAQTIVRENVESHQEKTNGVSRKNVESHQEKTAGTSKANVESRQEKTQALSKMNIESRQEKTEGAKVVNVEATTDQNAMEMEAKIDRNSYEIIKIRPDGAHRRLAVAVFVSGRVAIMNRHVYHCLSDTFILKNRFIESGFVIRLADLRVAMIPDDSIHYHKDVVAIEFPRQVTLHSDLSKYFMTKEDMSYHTSLKRAALLVPRDGIMRIRYTDKVKAGDRLFKLVPTPDTFHTIRDFYEYGIESAPGDCGGIVWAFDKNFNHKIIGIHMAAGEGVYSGVALAIHAQLLTTLVRSINFRWSESLIDGSCNVQCELVEEKPFPGDYVPVGKVPAEFMPSKTKIRPSPVHGVLQTPITKPAYLKPSWNAAHQRVDPLPLARSKAFGPNAPVNEEDLNRCANHYATVLEEGVEAEDQRVLTREEAIRGVEGEPFYTGIKRQTSPGYGWPKVGKGKTHYLGEDEYVTDHPEVVKATDEMLQRVKRGERSGTVWTDTLKDERRPIEKVEAGKTRLFAAGEMAYLILFRMYFMGFAVHMMRNRIRNESCVGMDVYSREWDILAKRMLKYGPHVIAGDFSNYDGTLSAAILWKCLDVIERFYSNSTEEERHVRRMLWLDIVQSIHVCGGDLYMWTHSQPSGCPITALLNSMYHSLVARYVYIQCARKHCPERLGLNHFSNYVMHNNYGDDDLWNIHPDIIDWFNQETMTTAFAEIGMTYTDELKSGNVVKSRSLEEVQFLKRRFRYDATQGRYRAPLSLDTILEMAMWIKGDVNVEELTKQTLEDAVHELAQHDEATFDQHIIKFNKARKIVPAIFLTYSEYQEVEYHRHLE